MGKSSFGDIRDGTGQIQIYLNAKELGDPIYNEILDFLDVGDFVSVHGITFHTRRGEPSIRVQRLIVAAKALRPLPDKWHGLRNPELRYRQRYLDLIANPSVRERFEARTEIIRTLRRVLDQAEFLEVETPTLQPIFGGGEAEPFVTRYEALNREYYLRIADELYLKRLLVSGFERIYEICKDFRNEGIDGTHSPEFTMLEAYQAFADLTDMIKLVETLVVEAVRTVHGGTVVPTETEPLDFSPPWRQIRYRDALLEATGLDLDDDEAVTDNALRIAASEHGVDIPQQTSRARLLDSLVKNLVEPTFVQPTLLIRYPYETAPLAKRAEDDARYVDRFEPFVNGMEFGNAFSELNDPLDQRKRMATQAQHHTVDGGPDYPMDEDFLRALEHGMPPAGGLGLGIDRLTMIITGASNIREVILFPQLRTPH